MAQDGFWRTFGSSTVVAAMLTAAGAYYTSTRVERLKADVNKDQKRFEIELQNKNAQLEKARASYSKLDDRLNQFEIALDRYVQICALISQKSGSQDLIITARQYYRTLTDKMGDVYEASAGPHIDYSVAVEVDSVLKPVSRNLEKAQQFPHLNQSAVTEYGHDWKQNIIRAKEKIKQAEDKLTAPL